MTNLLHVHDNFDTLPNKCSKNLTVNINPLVPEFYI